MIKLQEGDAFFCSDSLPKDWPVYVMMQSMHTNMEEKTDNFNKNSYSKMIYCKSKPMEFQWLFRNVV